MGGGREGSREGGRRGRWVGCRAGVIKDTRTFMSSHYYLLCAVALHFIETFNVPDLLLPHTKFLPPSLPPSFVGSHHE